MTHGLRTLSLVMGLGVAAAGLTSKLSSNDLQAPTHRRIVLHGVALDWERGAVQPDSAPILDEAVGLLKEGGSVEVVVLTEPSPAGSEQEPPARACGASIVRNYLADHGLSMARLMSVTVPPPHPPSLLALASDGSAHCRVGFVVD